MPRKRSRSRLYTRQYRNDAIARYWGDFRDYADVGGRREPLTPPAEKLATAGADVAGQLATARLQELERRRRNRSLLGVTREATLAQFASHHLVEKKHAGRVTDGWLAYTEMRLRRAVEFFGSDRPLTAIAAADVTEFIGYLQQLSNGRRGTLSGGTVRHH